MTASTADPALARRGEIAREAVLLAGDPLLRDVAAALAARNMDLLEVSVSDLVTAIRYHHAQRRVNEAVAKRRR
jgi:hypothetical protein